MSGAISVHMDDGTEFTVGPGTAYDIPSGHDGWVIGDEPWVTIIFAGVRGFGEVAEDERILVSILFTDIVGSTERATRMGDMAWKELLSHHDQLARDVMAEFRARLIKDTGDGFMALFDGAGRAVQCAATLSRVAESVGLEIRAGVHTGEVQLLETEVRGVAVHQAARIAALAGAGEVLVSSTTRELLGSSQSMAFEPRGPHELKGIDGQKELWALVS